MYILKCSDGSYYVGHSDDVERRVAEHESGAIPGYTKTRRPVKTVYVQEFPSRDEAFDAERQVKGWTRKKKEALIRSDWDAIRELAKKPSKASTTKDRLLPRY